MNYDLVFNSRVNLTWDDKQISNLGEALNGAVSDIDWSKLTDKQRKELQESISQTTELFDKHEDNSGNVFYSFNDKIKSLGGNVIPSLVREVQNFGRAVVSMTRAQKNYGTELAADTKIASAYRTMFNSGSILGKMTGVNLSKEAESMYGDVLALASRRFERLSKRDERAASRSIWQKRLTEDAVFRDQITEAAKTKGVGLTDDDVNALIKKSVYGLGTRSKIREDVYSRVAPRFESKRSQNDPNDIFGNDALRTLYERGGVRGSNIFTPPKKERTFAHARGLYADIRELQRKGNRSVQDLAIEAGLAKFDRMTEEEIKAQGHDKGLVLRWNDKPERERMGYFLGRVLEESRKVRRGQALFERNPDLNYNINKKFRELLDVTNLFAERAEGPGGEEFSKRFIESAGKDIDLSKLSAPKYGKYFSDVDSSVGRIAAFAAPYTSVSEQKNGDTSEIVFDPRERNDMRKVVKSTGHLRKNAKDKGIMVQNSQLTNIAGYKIKDNGSFGYGYNDNDEAIFEEAPALVFMPVENKWARDEEGYLKQKQDRALTEAGQIQARAIDVGPTLKGRKYRYVSTNGETEAYLAEDIYQNKIAEDRKRGVDNAFEGYDPTISGLVVKKKNDKGEWVADHAETNKLIMAAKRIATQGTALRDELPDELKPGIDNMKYAAINLAAQDRISRRLLGDNPAAALLSKKIIDGAGLADPSLSPFSFQARGLGFGLKGVLGNYGWRDLLRETVQQTPGTSSPFMKFDKNGKLSQLYMASVALSHLDQNEQDAIVDAIQNGTSYKGKTSKSLLNEWFHDVMDKDVGAILTETMLKTPAQMTVKDEEGYINLLTGAQGENESNEDFAKKVNAANKKLAAKRKNGLTYVGPEGQTFVRLNKEETAKNIAESLLSNKGLYSVKSDEDFHTGKRYIGQQLAEAIGFSPKMRKRSAQLYAQLFDKMETDDYWINEEQFSQRPDLKNRFEQAEDKAWFIKNDKQAVTYIENQKKAARKRATTHYMLDKDTDTKLAFPFVGDFFNAAIRGYGGSVDTKSDLAWMYSSVLQNRDYLKSKFNLSDKDLDKISTNGQIDIQKIMFSPNADNMWAMAGRTPSSLNTFSRMLNLGYLGVSSSKMAGGGNVAMMSPEAIDRMNTGDFDGDTVWMYTHATEDMFRRMEQFNEYAKLDEATQKEIDDMLEAQMTELKSKPVAEKMSERVSNAEYNYFNSQSDMGKASQLMRNALDIYDLQTPEGRAKFAKAYNLGSKMYDKATSEGLKMGWTGDYFHEFGKASYLAGRQFSRFQKDVGEYYLESDEDRAERKDPSIFKNRMISLNNMMALASSVGAGQMREGFGVDFGFGDMVDEWLEGNYGTNSLGYNKVLYDYASKYAKILKGQYDLSYLPKNNAEIEGLFDSAIKDLSVESSRLSDGDEKRRIDEEIKNIETLRRKEIDNKDIATSSLTLQNLGAYIGSLKGDSGQRELFNFYKRIHSLYNRNSYTDQIAENAEHAEAIKENEEIIKERKELAKTFQDSTVGSFIDTWSKKLGNKNPSVTKIEPYIKHAHSLPVTLQRIDSEGNVKTETKNIIPELESEKYQRKGLMDEMGSIMGFDYTQDTDTLFGSFVHSVFSDKLLEDAKNGATNFEQGSFLRKAADAWNNGKVKVGNDEYTWKEYFTGNIPNQTIEDAISEEDYEKIGQWLNSADPNAKLEDLNIDQGLRDKILHTFSKTGNNSEYFLDRLYNKGHLFEAENQRYNPSTKKVENTIGSVVDPFDETGTKNTSYRPDLLWQYGDEGWIDMYDWKPNEIGAGKSIYQMIHYAESARRESKQAYNDYIEMQNQGLSEEEALKNLGERRDWLRYRDLNNGGRFRIRNLIGKDYTGTGNDVVLNYGDMLDKNEQNPLIDFVMNDFKTARDAYIEDRNGTGLFKGFQLMVDSGAIKLDEKIDSAFGRYQQEGLTYGNLKDAISKYKSEHKPEGKEFSGQDFIANHGDEWNYLVAKQAQNRESLNNVMETIRGKKSKYNARAITDREFSQFDFIYDDLEKLNDPELISALASVYEDVLPYAIKDIGTYMNDTKKQRSLLQDIVKAASLQDPLMTEEAMRRQLYGVEGTSVFEKTQKVRSNANMAAGTRQSFKKPYEQFFEESDADRIWDRAGELQLEVSKFGDDDNSKEAQKARADRLDFINNILKPRGFNSSTTELTPEAFMTDAARYASAQENIDRLRATESDLIAKIYEDDRKQKTHELESLMGITKTPEQMADTQIDKRRADINNYIASSKMDQAQIDKHVSSLIDSFSSDVTATNRNNIKAAVSNNDLTKLQELANGAKKEDSAIFADIQQLLTTRQTIQNIVSTLSSYLDDGFNTFANELKTDAKNEQERETSNLTLKASAYNELFSNILGKPITSTGVHAISKPSVLPSPLEATPVSEVLSTALVEQTDQVVPMYKKAVLSSRKGLKEKEPFARYKSEKSLTPEEIRDAAIVAENQRHQAELAKAIPHQTLEDLNKEYAPRFDQLDADRWNEIKNIDHGVLKNIQKAIEVERKAQWQDDQYNSVSKRKQNILQDISAREAEENNRHLDALSELNNKIYQTQDEQGYARAKEALDEFDKAHPNIPTYSDMKNGKISWGQWQSAQRLKERRDKLVSDLKPYEDDINAQKAADYEKENNKFAENKANLEKERTNAGITAQQQWQEVHDAHQMKIDALKAEESQEKENIKQKEESIRTKYNQRQDALLNEKNARADEILDRDNANAEKFLHEENLRLIESSYRTDLESAKYETQKEPEKIEKIRPKAGGYGRFKRSPSSAIQNAVEESAEAIVDAAAEAATEQTEQQSEQEVKSFSAQSAKQYSQQARAAEVMRGAIETRDKLAGMKDLSTFEQQQLQDLQTYTSNENRAANEQKLAEHFAKQDEFQQQARIAQVDNIWANERMQEEHQNLALNQFDRQHSLLGRSHSRFYQNYNRRVTERENLKQRQSDTENKLGQEKATLERLQNQYKNATTQKEKDELAPKIAASAANVQKLNKELDTTKSQLQTLGGTGKNAAGAVFDSIGQSVTRLAARFGRQMFSKAINEVKQFVKEYDKSMTEIQMITLKSDDEISELGKNLIGTARSTGSTVTEVTSAASNLYRQGLSDEEVDERLDDVIKFSKVAGIKTTEASKIITTALQNGLVNNSTEAMDALVALGDSAATTASEIAKGMQKSAAAAKQSGMSYGELVTLLTIGTSKTQLGGSSIGSSLNTLIYRLYKVNNGEDFTDENGRHISSTAATKALSKLGVDLYDENGNFRGPYQILQDIGSRWNEADDTTQSMILTTLGAGRQRSNVATLLQGFAEDNGEIAQKYLDTAESSKGITDRKYDNYLDSLQAKLNGVKTSFDALIESFSLGGTTSGVLDWVSSFIDGLTEANSALEGMPALIIGIGVAVTALSALIKANPILAGGLLAVGAIAGFVSSLGNSIKAAQEVSPEENIKNISDTHYSNYENHVIRSNTKLSKIDKIIEDNNNLYERYKKSLSGDAKFDNKDQETYRENLKSLFEFLPGLSDTVGDFSAANSSIESWTSILSASIPAINGFKTAAEETAEQLSQQVINDKNRETRKRIQEIEDKYNDITPERSGEDILDKDQRNVLAEWSKVTNSKGYFPGWKQGYVPNEDLSQQQKEAIGYLMERNTDAYNYDFVSSDGVRGNWARYVWPLLGMENADDFFKKYQDENGIFDFNSVLLDLLVKGKLTNRGYPLTTSRLGTEAWNLTNYPKKLKNLIPYASKIVNDDYINTNLPDYATFFLRNAYTGGAAEFEQDATEGFTKLKQQSEGSTYIAYLIASMLFSEAYSKSSNKNYLQEITDQKEKEKQEEYGKHFDDELNLAKKSVIRADSSITDAQAETVKQQLLKENGGTYGAWVTNPETYKRIVELYNDILDHPGQYETELTKTQSFAETFNNARDAYREANPKPFIAEAFLEDVKANNITNFADLLNLVSNGTVKSFDSLLSIFPEFTDKLLDFGIFELDGEGNLVGLSDAAGDTTAAFASLIAAINGVTNQYKDNQEVYNRGETLAQAYAYSSGVNTSENKTAFDNLIGSASISQAYKNYIDDYNSPENQEIRRKHQEKVAALEGTPIDESQVLEELGPYPRFNPSAENLHISEFEAAHVQRILTNASNGIYGLTAQDRFDAMDKVLGHLKDGTYTQWTGEMTDPNILNQYISSYQDLISDYQKATTAEEKENIENEIKKKLISEIVDETIKYTKASQNAASAIKLLNSENEKERKLGESLLQQEAKRLANQKAAIKAAKGKSGEQLVKQAQKPAEKGKKDNTISLLSEAFGGMFSADQIGEMTEEELSKAIEGVDLDKIFTDMMQGEFDSLMKDQEPITIPLDKVNVNTDGTVDLSEAQAVLSGTAAEILAMVEALAKPYGSITLEVDQQGRVVSVNGILSESAGSVYSTGGGGGGGGKSPLDKLLEEQKYEISDIQHRVNMNDIETTHAGRMNSDEGYLAGIQKDIALRQEWIDILDKQEAKILEYIKTVKKGSEDEKKAYQALWSVQEERAKKNDEMIDSLKKETDYKLKQQEYEDYKRDTEYSFIDTYAQAAMSQNRFSDYEAYSLAKQENLRGQINANLLQEQEVIAEMAKYEEDSDEYRETYKKLLEIRMDSATKENQMIEEEQNLIRERINQIAKTLQYNDMTNTSFGNRASIMASVYQSGGYMDQYREAINKQIGYKQSSLENTTKSRDDAMAEVERIKNNPNLYGAMAYPYYSEQGIGSAASVDASMLTDHPNVDVYYEAVQAVYTYDEGIVQTTADLEELKTALTEADIKEIDDKLTDATMALEAKRNQTRGLMEEAKELRDYDNYNKLALQSIEENARLASEKRKAADKILAQIQSGELTPEQLRQQTQKYYGLMGESEDLERENRRQRRENQREINSQVLEDISQRSENYNHNMSLVQYEETRYQNNGEITNLNKIIGQENELRQNRGEQIQKDIELVKDQIEATKDDAEETERLTKKLKELEEEEIKNNNEIEKNNKTIKENIQKIRQLQIAVEKTIDSEIEKRKKTERDMLNARVSMENQILDVIRKNEQEKWNLTRKSLEEERKALNERKKNIDEEMNYKRKMLDQENKYEELAELQKQLALIEADPTRSKDAREIRKRIEDLHKEISMTKYEDEAQAEKERIDEELEGIAKYEEKGEKDLQDRLADANNFREQIYNLLESDNEQGFEDFMKEINTTYKNATEAQRKQMEDGWKDTWKTMKHILENNSEAIAKILESEDSFLNYMMDSDEYRNAENDNKRNSLIYNWSKAYEDWQAGIKDTAELVNLHDHRIANGNGEMNEIIDQAYDTNVNGKSREAAKFPEGVKYDTQYQNDVVSYLQDIVDIMKASAGKVKEVIPDNVGESTAQPESGGSGGNGGSSSNATKYYYQVHGTNPQNQKTVFGVNYDSKADAQVAMQKALRQGWTNLDIDKIKKYAFGGLVDYTGPAWVDGTKSKPEAFLSSVDVENIRALTKALSYVTIPSFNLPNLDSFNSNSQTVGDINITINQAELKSDADYEEVARKVGQAFTKQLSKEGFNLRSYAF